MTQATEFRFSFLSMTAFCKRSKINDRCFVVLKNPYEFVCTETSVVSAQTVSYSVFISSTACHVSLFSLVYTLLDQKHVLAFFIFRYRGL